MEVHCHMESLGIFINCESEHDVAYGKSLKLNVGNGPILPQKIQHCRSCEVKSSYKQGKVAFVK